MILSGQQLGRYHLSRLIGKGGMGGEVYLAQDTQVERTVALKVLRSDAFQTTYSGEEEHEALHLFRREARAIAKLDHPHILTLYDYGETTLQDNLVPYMVMPFCAGGSLDTWLKQRMQTSALALDVVLSLLSQAADALQYAHDLSIIHRDVKPANFLIRRPDETQFPDLLLADFGIASLFGTAETTLAGRVCGSPFYMAPEQWEGKTFPATDQYALAVMAYQMLTGRIPFQGSQFHIMYQHRFTEPTPPSQINPALSQDIDAVILQALAKDPDRRFTNVQAFAVALEQAYQQTISAPLNTTQLAPSAQLDTLPLEPAQPATPPRPAQPATPLRLAQAATPLVLPGQSATPSEQAAISPEQPARKPRRARHGFLLLAFAGCVIGALSSRISLTSLPQTELLIVISLLSLAGGAIAGRMVNRRGAGFTTGIIAGIVYILCIKLYPLQNIDPRTIYTVSIRLLQSLALRDVVLPVVLSTLQFGFFGLIGSLITAHPATKKPERTYPLPPGRKKYALLLGSIAGALCGITAFTPWDREGLFILSPLLCIVVGIIAGKIAVRRSTGFTAGLIMGSVYLIILAVVTGRNYAQDFLESYAYQANNLVILLGAYFIAAGIVLLLAVCLFGLLALLGAWLATLKHPYSV